MSTAQRANDTRQTPLDAVLARLRDCSGFPGLDNRFIRVALRTRRENNRLIKALRELLLP